MEAIGAEERGRSRINDLIFRELTKRRYAVEGTTRIWNLSDSKLWYLTNAQAQGFLDLEENEDYKQSITDKETTLLTQHVPDLVGFLQGDYFNIVDLGCGDGKKAARLIQDLREKLKLRYCPIDISSYMVNAAAKTIRETGINDVVQFKWNISDFENLANVTPLLREDGFQQHCMLLLGNTLGNFDRDDILHGIQQSTKPGDVLVIGNGLKDSISDDKVVEPYKDPSLDKFLIHVIEQIGLSASDVVYDARFRNSRVEMFYKVKADKTVKHLSRSVEFKEGDEILVAISYKFTRSELEQYLKRFFPQVSIFTDPEETYALAICSA